MHPKSQTLQECINKKIIYINIYGRRTSDIIPANAKTTDIIAFGFGFPDTKAEITVDTTITPPVRKGYCTDAGNTARAKTRRKLAI